MKKILIIILTVFVIVSCSDDLTDLNKDIKNPESVPAGALFANTQVGMFDFMTSTNVNTNNFRLWAQQWAQTTYADESNYILNERDQPGAMWDGMFAERIRDLNEFKILVDANANLSDAAKANQKAMAEILQVFAFHVLVDTFGDIPYSEAFGEDVTPKYDDDATIYSDLISRLNTAISTLSGASNLGEYDLVYGGDTDKWKMFGNSLKLRMAMRLAKAGDSAAQGLAEAAASGVFGSNDDNYLLVYQSSTPHTNPLWVDLVQSGRSDFIVTSTIVDPMKDLDDPRMPFYFSDPIDGEFLGGVYGDNNNYNAFSHPGEMQQDPVFPGIIMSYWEVQFLLADAASRGWSVGGTAEDFYNAGIEASIKYWGGSDDDVTTYLANPDVAWATAQGTDMEKIAMQKWLALYDQGFEAWSSYRMYDYPDLPIAAQAGIPTPRRYTYPVTEYSLNEESVAAAADAMGGDELDSRVFWDVAN